MTDVFRSSGNLAADRRYLWAEASEKSGDLAAAADLYEQTVEAAPQWPDAWLALGRVRAGLGDAAGADTALGRAEALDPGDVLGAGLYRARLAGGQQAVMSPAYVAGLFDAYADRFDVHLTGELAYCGPQVLLDALARLKPMPYGATLDLGCGTGLMAQALDGAAGPIDGVDLSAEMLRKAEGRGLYQALIRDDIVAATEALAQTRRYDLVLAADVVVYLGDLAPLFAAVQRVLEPAGLFAFTAQAKASGDGYSLGDDLRFHHSPHYLEAAADAAGLAVRLLEPVSTRRDGGREVPGHCVVLAIGPGVNG